MSQTYRVVLDGRVVQGADRGRVLEQGATIFKVSPEKMDEMLCGQTRVVKRSLDEETARRHVAIILQAGIACHVEVEMPGDNTSSGLNMVDDDSAKFSCPKCGHGSAGARRDDAFEECPRCGIIVQKYLSQLAAVSAPPHLSKPEPTPSNMDHEPASLWRRRNVAILVSAIFVLLLVKLFIGPSDKGKPSAAKQLPAHGFAYDIRGTYVGVGQERNFDSNFTYDAEIVVGPDYRISSATWTTRNSKGIKATAHWSQPATIEYRCQREGSNERLSLNDRRLSFIMSAEENSMFPVRNFDFVYDYDASVMASNIRPDGNFHIDPENGCLTATIAAAIPPIQGAHMKHQELHIELGKGQLAFAVQDAALKTDPWERGKSRIGEEYLGRIVTGFTLSGTLDFNISPLPIVCNVKMNGSFMRTADDATMLNPEEVRYTLTTNPVHWDIEVVFCPDGAMYALNKGVQVRQVRQDDAVYAFNKKERRGGSRKAQIYLKYILEKVE